MRAGKLRFAQAAIGQPRVKVQELCHKLGIIRQTLYMYMDSHTGFKPDAEKPFARQGEFIW